MDKKKKVAKIHREGSMPSYDNFNFQSFDRESELAKEVEGLRRRLRSVEQKFKQQQDQFNRTLTEKDIYVEEQVERAKAASYDQGFADGELQGKKMGHEEITPAINYFQNSGNNLENLTNQFFRDSENIVIDLVKSITEKSLSITIDQLPEATIEAIKQSIAVIQDRSSIKILVNRDQLSLVQEKEEYLKAGFDDLKHISIEVDSRVDKGGVIVESSSGVLDARVTTRIEEIFGKIDGARDEGE